MQINRLFELLYLLLNKKKMTARQLAERFEVSTRTIYRDIETLSSAGIPIYATKGKDGGISLMENFVFQSSLLSAEEQKNILASLKGLQVLNYPDAQKITEKLENLFCRKNQDWIEVDFSYWGSSEKDKKKFEQLKESVIKSKVVKIVYCNSSGESAERMIEPLKLYFKSSSWYLSAYCRKQNSLRMFKITRIRSYELLQETFEPKMEPKIENDYTHWGNEVTQLKFWIHKSMAFRVYDEFEEQEIQKLEDGNFIITASYFIDDWILGYLLSFGQYLELLEPKEVRGQFYENLKTLLKKYN